MALTLRGPHAGHRPLLLPGDLVIHDYDEARADCLRLVTEVHDSRLVTLYLTPGPGPQGGIEVSRFRLRRIDDFGLRVRVWRHLPRLIYIERSGAGSSIWLGRTPEAVSTRPHVHAWLLQLGRIIVETAEPPIFV